MVWVFYLIVVIWGIFCWGSLFKTTRFIEYARAVMDIKTLKPTKGAFEILNFLILLLSFLVATYYNLYGLTMTFYILIMSLTFLFIIRINSLFINKNGFSLFIVLIIVAFLGNLTGRIAFDVESPLLLETLFLGIFLIPVYLNYRIIFNEENTKLIISKYLKFFNSLDKNDSGIIEINRCWSLIQDLEKIDSFLEDEYTYLNFLFAKPQKQNLKMNVTSNMLSLFLNGDLSKLQRGINSKKKFKILSEILSIISSGRIGGDAFESSIKACWHLMEAKKADNKKDKILYELEITKAQVDLLFELKDKSFLVFCYKHLKNRGDSLRDFEQFMQILNELIRVMEWRKRITGFLNIEYYHEELKSSIDLKSKLFK